MRIVQLTNLVTPTSGGIRTTLEALGTGYVRAGHERHLVHPGPRPTHRDLDGGSAWALRGVRVPRSGGYRVLLRRRPVVALLEQLAPDVVEVSDRWTLTWVAGWARRHGVRSVALVHEHLGQTLRTLAGDHCRTAVEEVGTVADRRLSDAFDAVVCASTHSARPFGPAARVVPLGVDLAAFRPAADASGARRRPVRLVTVGRLSLEKRPELAVATVRHLHERGVDAHLDVVGDGPLRRRLQTAAAGLPVAFHGHLPQSSVAGLLAAADVAVCPCPIEAFGLAALEALACGTPVVATGGGPRDLLVGADPAAGAVVDAAPAPMARAVRDLLALPAARRRHAARAAAEQFPWSRSVESMLAVHADLPPTTGGARPAMRTGVALAVPT